MCLASSSDQKEIVRLFLEYGADPAIKTNQGTDALSIAVSLRHFEIVEMLSNARV
jgi:ankyrin repeat protein